ncbi:MAG: TIGR02266 family protein [Thermodesulfobacteriota bacterium]
MEIERRDTGRANVKLKVTFGSDTEFRSAFTADIGVGGLFLHTDRLLARGEHLYVEFNLPDSGEMVEAEAEVRWLRQNGTPEDGMGVKFLAMSQAHFAKVAGYLKKVHMLPKRSG